MTSEQSPFVQLFLARMREFAREPEVIFWMFGFPILLAIGLGIAFRHQAPAELPVAVLPGEGAERVIRDLGAAGGFDAELMAPDRAAQELRLGKVALVIAPGDTLEYRFDPTRPDGIVARGLVDDALQRAAGRTDPVAVRDTQVTEPGARYIDFLIPGLLGMNIMSGGMWGVGFVLVDMRARKLLKRLIAAPMRRSHFLGSMMASRMVMVFAEMVVLLLFAWLAFDLVPQGSLLLIGCLAMLGAFVFSGLGMLVASRAKKIESVSGLMNLVMVPMFVFSGIFFSSDRFPDAVQPFVQALPLTALNDALRAVILEGASLGSQFGEIGILLAWGGGASLLALRMFRWT